MGKILCECNSVTRDHELNCPAYLPIDKRAMDRSYLQEESRANMRVQNTYWLLNRAKENIASRNGKVNLD